MSRDKINKLVDIHDITRRNWIYTIIISKYRKFHSMTWG